VGGASGSVGGANVGEVRVGRAKVGGDESMWRT